MSVWEPGFYTAEQIGVLNDKYRELMRTGHVPEGIRLELQMQQEVPFEDLEVKQSPIRGTEDIRPEVVVNLDEIADMPPRVGPGSSTFAWAEFAAAVSDIEEEVLENLGREEIIDLLIDKGIINEEDD